MRVLVCIVAVVLTLKGTVAQSSCDATFTGLSTEEDGHTFTVPETCTYGVVNWGNPQGNLILELEREQPFTLCIGQTFFASTINQITVTSDDGVETLDIPSQYFPSSCKTTTGEEMTVTLRSFSQETNYFDYFYYFIFTNNNPVPAEPASLDIDK